MQGLRRLGAAGFHSYTLDTRSLEERHQGSLDGWSNSEATLGQSKTWLTIFLMSLESKFASRNFSLRCRSTSEMALKSFGFKFTTSGGDRVTPLILLSIGWPSM